MAGRAFSAFYARSFERRPWLTLAVANGTLGVIADGLAQSFEKVKRRKESVSDGGEQQLLSQAARTSTGYDAVRGARFFAFGAGMAPLLAEWNKFIEFRFPLRALGGAAGKVSMLALAKRVAVDQIGFAPFGLTMFVGSMGLMEGRSAGEIKQKFSDVFVPAILANWQVWPLVQAVNFRFMPLKYRVPFTSSMGILWTIYLSLLNMSRSSHTVKHNV